MSLPPANWDCFIDDSCVLCLLFEEGEGDTAHDLSRFRNDGTIYGASWVGTPYGRGLSLDGVDDYVEVPDSPSLDVNSTMTIEAYIRIDEIPSETENAHIVRKEGAYGFWVKRDSLQPWGRIWQSDGTEINLPLNMAITLGRWYVIDIVADGAKLKMYINGHLNSEAGYDGTIRTTDAPLRICLLDPANPEHWKGIMAYLLMFNRALSADELRALHQSFRYGLACYKLIGQVINPLISDTYERVELIRKIQTNRWRIENNRLVIYDDDGVTPLLRFNLKDKYGNPSEVNVYEREPV